MVDKPVIALVGGIGAGKSAVAAALARRGGRVIDADRLGHAALRDPAVRRAVLNRWPSVAPTGEIDRHALGRIVFAESAARQELEGIVYPWIRQRVSAEIDAAKCDPSVRFVVLDAAVILEAGWDAVWDKLLFVDAPREARLARVASRGWTPEELDRREASQWPLEKKRARADAVIDNSGTPADLASRVDQQLASWGLASTE